MVNRIGFLYVTLAMMTSLSRLPAGEGWFDSYEEARDSAEKAGLPLLIHFQASYCGPCRRMDQQVFSRPEVQRQLRAGLAAVEVDVSEHPELAARYRASTVPRDVVVYPGRAPETLNVGFKSTSAYLALLSDVATQGARIAAALKSTSEKPTPENPASAAPQKLVGLDGFCPVRLIRDREWISGREELSDKYRGVTYYFSSEADRDLFRKSPRSYTPQNLGCDPVVLYFDQRAATGKTRFGAFFDKQLFLFESPQNRSQFKANPLKYARIRHAIKVDDLAGQRFH